MKVLVIAAHPDDEVLGMGGTIKKLSKNNKIELCVVTEGVSAQYKDEKMIQLRKSYCSRSGKILGISKIHFLDFSDMKLDNIPKLEINLKLENIIKRVKPDIVYTTSKSDLNEDHRIVYESTLVVTRPNITKIKSVYSYEVPGNKIESFKPNLYEDISKTFTFKIKAFKKYESEIEEFPHSRSLDSIENLAVYRGIESGIKKAEAFEIIRMIKN